MRENIKIGIDIVEIKRIKKILREKRDKFLNKIFSDLEIAYIDSREYKPNTVAAMFAAKEATSKLLGSGIGKLNWKDIEVYHKENGRPYINLNQKIRDVSRKMDIANIDISISHEREYALAIALGTKIHADNEIEIQLPDNLKDIIVSRKAKTHKGTYGKLAIIAGSKGMTGAPYLSSLAALRAGAGLVYSLVPKSIEYVMSIKLTEVIVNAIEDDSKGHFTKNSLNDILNRIEDMDVIGIGPGMGVDDDRLYIVKEIIKNSNKPIVIDADGINCLSIEPNVLYNKNKEIIITPHPGELGRFLGKKTHEIQENRIFYSKYAADKYNIIVALKGSHTIVACPGVEEVYINTTGNPGMATAGSGDVLTGIICSFIGQGINTENATRLGVFIHGLAGDLAKLDKGEYGLIATDIIENLPKSIKKIQG